MAESLKLEDSHCTICGMPAEHECELCHKLMCESHLYLCCECGKLVCEQCLDADNHCCECGAG